MDPATGSRSLQGQVLSNFHVACQLTVFGVCFVLYGYIVLICASQCRQCGVLCCHACSSRKLPLLTAEAAQAAVQRERQHDAIQHTGHRCKAQSSHDELPTRKCRLCDGCFNVVASQLAAMRVAKVCAAKPGKPSQPSKNSRTVPPCHP